MVNRHHHRAEWSAIILLVFACHCSRATREDAVLQYDMSLPLTRQACEVIATPAALATDDVLMTVPNDPLTQREHCSVCDIIVHNSRKWSIDDGDLRPLCTGIPPHAQRWCMYYACKLLLYCPYFYQKHTARHVGAPCNVSQVSVPNHHFAVLGSASSCCQCCNFVWCVRSQGKSGMLSAVSLFPCPAKYICSYCLDVPTFQTFGCFDGLKL